jgi:hypothetical protein
VAFYFTEETLNAVPISSAFVSEIEVIPKQYDLEQLNVADQKLCVFYIIFFAKATQDEFAQRGSIRRKETEKQNRFVAGSIAAYS